MSDRRIEEKPMNHSLRERFCFFTLACALVVPSLASAADQVEDSIDAQFKAMDLDGDGRLTPAEHAAGARRMFVAMDANGDGKVTAAEMDAAQEKITGRKAGPSDMSSADKIKVVDTDGDGILTADEHATASRTMFEKMDTDKDGFVSKAEFAAGHAKMLRKQN
jgi:Ca2+-binding EF-hand superfamily protein